MKKREIIVEILIWLAVLTAVLCGIFFAYSKIFVDPNTYSIKFKDIDGITKGSPVRFMGINVGYVKKLTSVEKSVVVQILITKKDVKIPNGTTARVEFYGLGGSKSIELMPSNSEENDGIVTTDNIRIADVVSKAKSLVEIVEIIEKFVKSLDKSSMQNILENIENTDPNKIKQAEVEMNKVEKNISFKVEDVRNRQSKMVDAVKKVDDMVLNINKFIKK